MALIFTYLLANIADLKVCDGCRKPVKIPADLTDKLNAEYVKACKVNAGGNNADVLKALIAIMTDYYREDADVTVEGWHPIDDTLKTWTGGLNHAKCHADAVEAIAATHSPF